MKLVFLLLGISLSTASYGEDHEVSRGTTRGRRLATPEQYCLDAVTK